MGKSNHEILCEIEKELTKKVDHDKVTSQFYSAFVAMLLVVARNVTSYEDFTGTLFWNFMDEITATTNIVEDRKKYIHCLCRLFLLAQKKIPDIDLFADVNNLKMYLLKMEKTKCFLADGYVNRDNTFLYRKNSKGGLGIWTLEFSNSFLAEIFVEWLNEFNGTKVRTDVGIPEMTNTFEQSFGHSASCIRSIDSLSGATFREQVNYYKQRHKDDPIKIKRCIKYVVYFYRYIIMNNPEFELCDPVYTKQLFMHNNFVKWLCEDYHIETYNPYGEAPSWEKTVFILKGFNKYSSGYLEEDYIVVNLKNITNEKYRKMLHEYLLSSPSNVVASRGGNLLVTSHFPMVLKLKQDPDNPNSNLFYYTRQEAILIRRAIMGMPCVLASKNNIIGAFRRFLKWASDTGKIMCDPQFFDYMKQIEEPSKFKVADIPDEDLKKLIYALKEMSSEDDLFFIVYVAFLIQVNTHFRIGTICSLETDCIKDSMKPGKYMVCTNAKTSHGEKHEYPVLEEMKLLIDAAIDKTEMKRDQVAGVKALKKKIFLYKVPGDKINCLDTNAYREVIQKACERAGLPLYHSRNIRNTYMTKAVEFVVKSGKSDAELGPLTKHLNFSTTNHSYLSLKLDEMLEATYGIIIGDATEYESNIVDEFPDEIGENRIVENGCGRCASQNSCEILVPLNCLACEHFRTTIDHEMYFIKAIEQIDQMIKSAKTPHDIEDLTIVKRLYVMYLKTIYMIKEEQSNANS